MQYESVILELMERVQKLERQVAQLQGQAEELPEPAGERITTGEIRDYILARKRRAKEEGAEELILRSGELHRELGLHSRMPMVCNAMRQCMGPEDQVLAETPSGYSSTLRVRYDLTHLSD